MKIEVIKFVNTIKAMKQYYLKLKLTPGSVCSSNKPQVHLAPSDLYLPLCLMCMHVIYKQPQQSMRNCETSAKGRIGLG